MNYDRAVKYRRPPRVYSKHLRSPDTPTRYSMRDALKTAAKVGEFALDAYNAYQWLDKSSRESGYWTQRVPLSVWKQMSPWEKAKGIQNSDPRLWPTFANDKARAALSEGLKYAKKILLGVY